MERKWLWLVLFIAIDVIGVGAILVENMPVNNSAVQTELAQDEQFAGHKGLAARPTQHEHVAQKNVDGVLDTHDTATATNTPCNDISLGAMIIFFILFWPAVFIIRFGLGCDNG